MKPKIISIYIFVFNWFALYADPLINNYGKMNDIALKFLLMGVVVPPVAIYMLYIDEKSPSPSRRDIVATIVLSMILIWLGYEISVDTFVPVWAGLLLSFVFGLFSLSIVMKVRDKMTGKDGIIDTIFNGFKRWILKKFGNDEK